MKPIQHLCVSEWNSVNGTDPPECTRLAWSRGGGGHQVCPPHLPALLWDRGGGAGGGAELGSGGSAVGLMMGLGGVWLCWWGAATSIPSLSPQHMAQSGSAGAFVPGRADRKSVV